jgi:hypothetical protein
MYEAIFLDLTNTFVLTYQEAAYENDFKLNLDSINIKRIKTKRMPTISLQK